MADLPNVRITGPPCAGNMMVIPERMSFDEAAIVEPLSCAYHGFTRCPTVPGDTVLIIGAGNWSHARPVSQNGWGLEDFYA